MYTDLHFVSDCRMAKYIVLDRDVPDGRTSVTDRNGDTSVVGRGDGHTSVTDRNGDTIVIGRGDGHTSVTDRNDRTSVTEMDIAESFCGAST